MPIIENEALAPLQSVLRRKFAFTKDQSGKDVMERLSVALTARAVVDLAVASFGEDLLLGWWKPNVEVFNIWAWAGEAGSIVFLATTCSEDEDHLNETRWVHVFLTPESFDRSTEEGELRFQAYRAFIDYVRRLPEEISDGEQRVGPIAVITRKDGGKGPDEKWAEVWARWENA